MLTLFDALQLTMRAYETDSNSCPENWEIVAKSEQWLDQQASKDGFSAIVFRHLTDTHLYVIAYRGTEPNISKQREGTSGFLGNLVDDSALYLNKIPESFKYALSMRKKCVDNCITNRNIMIAHVGHSLGGALAHFSGYYHNDEVISFDNPGWIDCIKLLKYDEVNLKQLLSNHYTFLSVNNLINSVNTHVGEVYVLPPTVMGSTPIDHTKEAHKLDNFFNVIDKNSAHPRTSIPNKFIPYREIIAKGEVLKPNKNGILKIKSKLSDLEFSPQEFVVSKINTGGMFEFGHLILIVEGLVQQSDNPIDGYTLFVGQYDLIALKLEESTELNVIIRAFESNNYNRDYSRFKGLHRLLPADKTIEMIASIREESAASRELSQQGRSLMPYVREGSGCFFAKNQGHNCVTWAEEKLEIAGWQKDLVEKKKTLFQYSAAMPAAAVVDSGSILGSGSVQDNSNSSSSSNSCSMM